MYIGRPTDRREKKKGNGRTVKVWKRSAAIAVLLGMSVSCTGCSVEKIDTAKLRDLDYEEVKEWEIPDALQEIIAERKQEDFLCTWADPKGLYIARGYGKQETDGCQIQVDAFFESAEALILETTLWGPVPESGTTDEQEESESCPYLVIRTEYCSKYVIAK